MIRILIADDHQLVREGLRRMIAEQPDFEVIGEAGTGEALLAAVERSAVDVVLLDISMPGPSVTELLSALGGRSPPVRAVVLSMHPEEQYAVRLLRAGAAAYLTKDRSPEHLVAAVRKAAAGGRYITPSLAEHLAGALDEPPGLPHEQLSERELQVLRMLASGRSVKRIAATLSLSPKTVSTYRTRMLEKLGLRTTADLIRYALQHDLEE
jgi:two-component system, NarL family, invasion response regulator UvrY